MRFRTLPNSTVSTSFRERYTMGNQVSCAHSQNTSLGFYNSFPGVYQYRITIELTNGNTVIIIFNNALNVKAIFIFVGEVNPQFEFPPNQRTDLMPFQDDVVYHFDFNPDEGLHMTDSHHYTDFRFGGISATDYNNFKSAFLNVVSAERHTGFIFQEL